MAESKKSGNASAAKSPSEMKVVGETTTKTPQDANVGASPSKSPNLRPKPPAATSTLKPSKWARLLEGIYRLANGLMVLYFLYCAYVQWNDPDAISFMAFYGICALQALLKCVFGNLHLDALHFTMDALGFYLFYMSGKNDQLWANWQADPEASSRLLFSLRTETGRERTGIVLAVFWGFLARYMPKGLSVLLLLATSVLMLLAARYAPQYGMQFSDIAQVAHCHGLGWTPSMPSDHPPLGASGGKCPFTGKSRSS